MRRKWPRITATAMAVVLTAGLSAGCGKKATPENLLGDMKKNMEKTESLKCNIRMETETCFSTDTLTFNLDWDMHITDDPEALYINGTMDTTLMGEDTVVDIEMYAVEEDGEYVSYSLVDDVWTKTTADDIAEDYDVDIVDSIEKHADLFEMSDALVEVNGKDCFEMSGDITGDVFTGLVGQQIEYYIEGTGQELSDVEIPCTIAVYRDRILPAKITMDMSEFMEMADVESKFRMEVEYLEYNTVDEIKIPKEAASAEEADPLYDDSEWDDDYEWDDDFDGDDDSEWDDDDTRGGSDTFTGAGTEGDWQSHSIQINDKMLTIPCSPKELEALGLTLNTEYLIVDESTIIAPYGLEIVKYEDARENTLFVIMANTGAEPMPLKDCQIGGITAYDYYVEGMDVRLPGGIQIGSSIEDVLKVYGEADDVHEGEDSDTYYWYGDEDFISCCTIETDPETGSVQSIGITHY